jgi:photosystem II stability/assembly factor-like uncharacterized protein
MAERGVRLFATTGDAVARVTVHAGDRPDVSLALEGSGAQCVAVDPLDPRRVYVGTFDNGIYRTLDGGDSWDARSEMLPDKRVLSIAVSPCDQVSGRSVVYAGTEPSNLYRSEDDGRTWQSFPGLHDVPSAPTWSFPPRPWTSHVRWIAPHHFDSSLLFAGIELGGVMRSRDGGEHWEDRKPGSQPDSHVVLTHPVAAARVYEAAGGGVALSRDCGDSWQPVDDGMDRHYVWGLAADPADPDLWYVSATWGPGHAHSGRGDARAALYRKRGDAPWEALGGMGGKPLRAMPYALSTLADRPNALVVGYDDGELLLTQNAGESWTTLQVRLPGILALDEAPGLD